MPPRAVERGPHPLGECLRQMGVGHQQDGRFVRPNRPVPHPARHAFRKGVERPGADFNVVTAVPSSTGTIRTSRGVSLGSELEGEVKSDMDELVR